VFKNKMSHPSSILRLTFMLAILTLIPITMACGSRSAPTPTPTPPWYENPSEPQLPEAESLCEAAFSSSQSDGSPTAPVLTMIKKEYEEGKWAHGPKIGPIEASSAAEVQTIVCILESRLVVGSYTNAGNAYKLVWDVRLVRLPDGKVLGAQRFTGGDPPENIMVNIGEGGEGCGAPPTLDAFNWILPTLGNRTILYAGGSVDSVAFSADGPLLALGSEMVKLWDVSTRQEEVRTLEQVEMVMIQDGKEIPILMPADHSDAKVHSVAFSPDGQLLASGSSDTTIKLRDVATGREIRTFSGHTGEVTGVVFSPDGTLLASGSLDKTVKLWDVATGREIRTFSGHSSVVGSIAFAPDGTTLASGVCMKFQEGDVNILNYWLLLQSKCTQGEVQLWQISDGTLLRALEGHKDLVSSVAFAPGGQTLASGSWDKTVKLWDVEAGQVVSTLKGHTGQVTSVAFSPDGALLASGSWDNTVRLWRVSDGSLLHTLEGHIGLIQSVAFSPDGPTLASGGSDGVVKLWDVATGQ
jgi:hypothetical protein